MLFQEHVAIYEGVMFCTVNKKVGRENWIFITLRQFLKASIHRRYLQSILSVC